MPGDEVTFVTGAPVDPDATVRWVMLADQYVTEGAQSTGKQIEAVMAAAPLDFALHVGDISYAEGNVAIWNAWHEIAEPITSRLPYHLQVGNHEADYSGPTSPNDPSGVPNWRPSFWNGGDDSGGECGVPTAARFRAPPTTPTGSPSNQIFWYSFAVGSVQMIMLSSEHDPSPGSAQGAWLADELSKVDRSATPWLLVHLHRPLVETEAYAGDYAVAQGLRKILEPVLLAARVDVVFAGHYHSFQRTCACANMSCEDGGIVHYTQGAAGAALDDITLYPSTVVEKTLLGVFGFSTVTANRTALVLEFVDSVDGKVADTVVLRK